MTGTFTTSIEIAAAPDRVFAYFTRPDALVTWMGEHAVLDARPGGEFTLDIEGIPVRGRYVVVDRPHRIVVSWGHAGSESMPPGSTIGSALEDLYPARRMVTETEVEFSFTPNATGTLVTVEHRGLPDEHVDSHRTGWPMFLDRLARVVEATRE